MVDCLIENRGRWLTNKQKKKEKEINKNNEHEIKQKKMYNREKRWETISL